MALSKRLRFEILRRDNHTCRYCGGAARRFRLCRDCAVGKALFDISHWARIVTKVIAGRFKR